MRINAGNQNFALINSHVACTKTKDSIVALQTVRLSLPIMRRFNYAPIVTKLFSYLLQKFSIDNHGLNLNCLQLNCQAQIYSKSIPVITCSKISAISSLDNPTLDSP